MSTKAKFGCYDMYCMTVPGAKFMVQVCCEFPSTSNIDDNLDVNSMHAMNSLKDGQNNNF